MTTTAIGCDWGTSVLRAYRLGPDNAILESRVEPAGIMNIEDGDFDAVFERVVGDWLDDAPDIPVILSGMIGSRHGWREAPYCSCPADLRLLADDMITVTLRRGRDVLVAPGLSCRGDDDTPDVMRGEEVQILGALDALGMGQHLVCLPGTHSKWVEVRDGTVQNFSTFMTGEVFQALRDHTILSRMLNPHTWSETGFRDGLDRAQRCGHLLADLFGLRARSLFGEIPERNAAAWLSGLLIGHELNAMLSETGPAPHLIGSGQLTDRYATALAHRGIRCRVFPPDIVADGHARLAGTVLARSAP